MKYAIFLLSLVLLLQTGNISGEKGEKKIMEKNHMDKINNSMHLLEKIQSIKKKHMTLLRDCKYGDTMINEYNDYYEVIFNHPDTDNSTGGAECYEVNKKTGHEEMIWHEHPMPLKDFMR